MFTKGKLTSEFHFVPVTTSDLYRGEVRNVNKDDVIKFEKDEVVEILKVVSTKEFLSGTAYIVYSPKSHECMTIDPMFVELIND